MTHLQNTTPANPAQGVSGERLAQQLADIARSLLSRPVELRGPWKHDEESLRRVAALPPRTSKAKVDVTELTFAIGAGGQAVAVKALEWSDNIAATSIGSYSVIDRDDEGATWTYHEYPYGDESEPLPSVEAAKAAAQADYERRVLSALSNPPAQPGWRLVPEEPTLAMQNAGWREAERQGIDINEVELSPIYRAMLSAAPQPKGE